MPKSIDFDNSEGSPGDRHNKSFDEDQYVLMSDNVVIRRDEVLYYKGGNDEHDAETLNEHHLSIDTIVISSVAGMSAVALGLALRRLRKKAKGE